jgi:hypothetical protein
MAFSIRVYALDNTCKATDKNGSHVYASLNIVRSLKYVDFAQLRQVLGAICEEYIERAIRSRCVRRFESWTNDEAHVPAQDVAKEN